MTDSDAPHWHPGLALGNALLDRQHILMMELARTLDDPAVDDASAHNTVADILDIAQRHCAAEEYLLTANGYEWGEQHREEHVAGLDRLRALCVESALGTVPRNRLAAAVRDWIVFHVVDMDLPARAYLRPVPLDTGLKPGRDPLDADWA